MQKALVKKVGVTYNKKKRRKRGRFDMADTIAAIASGKIPCAIGILRLSGDGCAEIAGQVFDLQAGIPLAQAPNRKLMLGTLRDLQGRVIDQALAVYTRAPHTYTGEAVCRWSAASGPRRIYKAGLFKRADGPDPSRGRHRPH